MNTGYHSASYGSQASSVAATITGVLKATAGIIDAAVPGTDYVLPAGVAGGQTITGGTAASQTLTLRSTSHATLGKVIFGAAGTSAYDEVNERWGFGTASPAALTRVHAAAPTGTCVVACEAVVDNTTNLIVYQLKSAGSVIGSVTATGPSYAGSANVTVPINGVLLNANNAGGVSIAAGHASGAVRVYAGGTLAANLAAKVFSDGKVGVGSIFGTATPDVLLQVGGLGQTAFFRASSDDTTSSQAGYTLGVTSTAAAIGSLVSYPSTFTTSGHRKANGISLFSNNTGGLSLGAFNASGDIRLYTGGSLDANLRATVSSAGVWTVPLAGKKAEVAGAATATFSITALDGDTAVAYRLHIHLINATASDCVIRLRPNGASTNLNAMVTTQNESGTSTSTADTALWLCNMRATSEAWITVTAYCKTGKRRRFTWHATSSRNSDQFANQLVGGGGWNETATNITSFDVVSDVATSIAIGSTIRAEVIGFLLG
jgi:hypothetical protein